MLSLTETQVKIFDSLYDGVVIADQEGRILYVNSAHERITGVPRAAALGKLAREVVPDTALPNVLQSGQAQIGVRTKAGDKEVLSNIVPIWDNGQICGAVSIFRDITELRELGRRLKKAEHQIKHLTKELNNLRSEGKELVIGSNPAVAHCFQLAAKAARANSPVLLLGESGTGKEVIARYIHTQGSRSNLPFVPINCAAIPEALLESELFGYEEGAFTGAKKGGNPGILEIAHGGTVFLDEIGDMPTPLQAKLLRVLEDGMVRRLGSSKATKVDIRVIAATNKPLDKLISGGLFREDLFYRINVIPIHLPPLRERREDIPRLVGAILQRLQEKLGRRFDITPQAMRLLVTYHFPGNIRELENVMEGAAVVCNNDRIYPEDVREFLHQAEKPGKAEVLNVSLAEIEREIILEGLAKGKKKEQLASELGISRATLYRRVAGYRREL